MGFHPIQAWKALFRNNQHNHELQEWEKEKGIYNSRISKLQNALLDKKLDLMQKVLDAKDSANSETEMLKMIMTLVSGTRQQEFSSTPIVEKAVNPDTEIILTEPQIREMVKANPAMKLKAKFASEDRIRTEVLHSVPNISKESLNKMIEVIKE